MNAHTWVYTFEPGQTGAACSACGAGRTTIGASIDAIGECTPAATSHTWQVGTAGSHVKAGCAGCGAVRFGRVRDPWEPGYFNVPAVDLSGECSALVPA